MDQWAGVGPSWTWTSPQKGSDFIIEGFHYNVLLHIHKFLLHIALSLIMTHKMYYWSGTTNLETITPNLANDGCFILLTFN